MAPFSRPADPLFVQIFVDVWTKCAFRHALYTVVLVTFILFQEWCTRETDEHNFLTHDGSHGFMKATTLCAVAFIDEDKDVVTLYTEIVAIFLCNDSLQFFKVFIQTNFCA